MSRPILSILRRTLSLFLIILIIISLQVKLSGLPFTFTLRFVYIYYTACLLVSAGYELVQYLYREEDADTRDWEEIIKDKEAREYHDPLPFPKEKN